MSSGRTPIEIAKFINEQADNLKLKTAEFLRVYIPDSEILDILHVLPKGDRLSFVKSTKIDFDNDSFTFHCVLSDLDNIDLDFCSLYMPDIIKFSRDSQFDRICSKLPESCREEFKEKFEKAKSDQAKSEKQRDGIYVAPGARVTVFGRNASVQGATVGEGAQLTVVAGATEDQILALI